jgi:hypothetical protein
VTMYMKAETCDIHRHTHIQAGHEPKRLTRSSVQRSITKSPTHLQRLLVSAHRLWQVMMSSLWVIFSVLPRLKHLLVLSLSCSFQIHTASGKTFPVLSSCSSCCGRLSCVLWPSLEFSRFEFESEKYKLESTRCNIRGFLLDIIQITLPMLDPVCFQSIK